jgi:hypothetical protein
MDNHHTILLDGASYHFREWPDDGETFEFRAFGPGSTGVLVNLTNPGDQGNFWVDADGSVRTADGHHVFDVADLAGGPGDVRTGRAGRA